MSIFDTVLDVADVGLMPLGEIFRRVAGEGNRDHMVSRFIAFIANAYEHGFSITGFRDADPSRERECVPLSFFEAAIVFDWSTATDDQLYELMYTSRMRFISVNGHDGDTIKLSSETFRPDDLILWSRLAMPRADAEKLLTGSCVVHPSVPKPQRGRPSLELATEAIASLWPNLRQMPPASRRNQQIQEWVKKNGAGRTVSDRTINKAIQALRS